VERGKTEANKLNGKR